MSAAIPFQEDYFRELVGPEKDRWRTLQDDLSARADENERMREPTAETLEILRDFGLFRAVLKPDDKGWGVGIWNRRPLGLWTINRRIGFADPSIAHCLQLHNNVLDLIFDIAPDPIKERARQAVLAGDIFAAWGASRFEATPWVATRRGRNGYVANGNAFFCTNAGFATKALIMAVCPEDKDVPYNGLLFALIDADRPGVQIRPEWWNKATGMIATASHRVELTNVDFTRDDIIADGRDIKRLAVQTRFMPQFASNFLGMMERIFAEARAYTQRGKAGDELARARLGQLALLILRTETLMRETARVWLEQPGAAPFTANAYRSEAGQALVETIDHAGILLGGGGMMTNFAFSKIARDALTMLRHENTDKIKATLGALCLDQADADVNYSGRQPVEV